MSDPYATHLPILEGLCNLIEPKRVLEFGAGLHSTSFFLSRSDLEYLLSIERDPRWYQRLADKLHDRRLKLVRAGTPHLAEFDLVFIDDGKNAADRETTIRWVLGQDHPPVVIHDAEVPEYRQAIRELAGGCSLLFCLEKPHTAVVWSEGWDQDRHEIGMEVSRCAS